MFIGGEVGWENARRKWGGGGLGSMERNGKYKWRQETFEVFNLDGMT